MTKKVLVIVLFIGLFLLSGCDYDEKSLQALSDYDVPDEVTMDFELPRGVYGEIIYSSSDEEVLSFTNVRFAKVVQQQEDRSVTITARVNRSTKQFTTIVLKTGSTPTPLEQARCAFAKLNIPTQTDSPYLLTAKIDDIDFRYEQFHPYRLTNDPYRIVHKTDDSVWLVPNLLLVKADGNLVVRAFLKIDDQDVFIMSQIYTIEFGVKADITDYDRVIDEVEIGTKLSNRRFRVNENFDLPTVSQLVPQAIIEWSSSDETTVQIAQDKRSAIIKPPISGIREVTLTAYITIDEITHPMLIQVEVISD